MLKGLAGLPLVKGVRHKPRPAAMPAEVVRGAPGSMSDPRWRAGYAELAAHGLHFELQTPWWHLDEALDLAMDYPDTALVLNHTGLPADRSPAGLAGWKAAMRRLAAAPQVSVKISGLGLRDQPWRAKDNVEIIRDTIGIFGWDCCLFASNFPVDGLCGGLNQIYAGFATIVAHLPWEQLAALFHDNAVRVYRLDRECIATGGMQIAST